MPSKKASEKKRSRKQAPKKKTPRKYGEDRVPRRKVKREGRLPRQKGHAFWEKAKRELERRDAEEDREEYEAKCKEARRHNKEPPKKDKPRKPKRICESPTRRCLSPIQDLRLKPAIRVMGKELGLPGLNQDVLDENPISPRAGLQRMPSQNLPRIYVGDASPTPRWLIRPAIPEPAQEEDLSSQSSTSSGSKLPPLGRLRWEFDAGPAATHGQNEAWLRSYAYQYLLNSLSDGIVRDEMRDLIWNGPYAATVAHVEDPLPIPPPPALLRDKKPSDYANLPPPISAATPDDYYFLYSDYSRPSLATSVATRAPECPSPSVYESSSELNSSNGRYYTATTRQSPLTASEESPWDADPGATPRTRASTIASTISNIIPMNQKYRSSQESSAQSRHFRSDDEHHIGPDTPGNPSAPGKSSLSKPPRRMKVSHARSKPSPTYVEIPTLDELRAKDGPPEKRPGRRRSTEKATNSGTELEFAFTDDEDIPLPKLPVRRRNAVWDEDVKSTEVSVDTEGDVDIETETEAFLSSSFEDDDEEFAPYAVARKVKRKGVAKGKRKRKGKGKEEGAQ